MGYALAGLRAAFAAEDSFRVQLAAGAGALAVTLALRAPPLWLALVVMMIGLVLAAELINTALEHALDALHPEPAPLVRLAKDCAAAAVLVLSLTSVAVFLLMLWAMLLP